MSFLDQLKKTAAEGLVAEGRFWLRILIAAVAIGSITYFYGSPIKRYVVHLVTAPFSYGADKAKKIGTETKAVVKDAVDSARDAKNELSDKAGAKYDAMKEQVPVLVDKAKDGVVDTYDATKEAVKKHTPAILEETKKGASHAVEGAKDISGNLKERWRTFRNPPPPKDDVME